MRYFLLVLVFSVPLIGQTLPEAPSQALVATVPATEPAAHSFLQRGNQIRMAVLAGLIAADGITTQHILTVDHGSELNPLVRPMVRQGAVGQLGASLLGYGLGLGSSYLFHRSGHHRLERLVLNTSIVVESECVTSNLVQIGLGPH